MTCSGIKWLCKLSPFGDQQRGTLSQSPNGQLTVSGLSLRIHVKAVLCHGRGPSWNLLQTEDTLSSVSKDAGRFRETSLLRTALPEHENATTQGKKIKNKKNRQGHSCPSNETEAIKFQQGFKEGQRTSYIFLCKRKYYLLCGST